MNFTKKSTLLGVLSCLLIIQCTANTTPKKKKLQLTKEFTLGSDSTEVSKNKIFSLVTNIVTDDQDKLYIVDAKEPRIRVYDKNRNFLRYLGSKGSGPGEFKDISALYINKNNQLIAADPQNGRITIFSLQGKLIATHEFPTANVEQITQLPDGSYVLVGYNEEKFVHIVDPNFSEIQQSIVNKVDILNTEKKLEKMLVQFDPGRVVVSGQESIIFAPKIYAGELLKYKKKAEKEWQLDKIIEGYNRHKKPVSFSTFKQAKRVDIPMRMPNGRFAAQLHSRSNGFYKNGKSKFIHFSIQEKDSGSGLDIIAEQFSTNNTLNYYAVIDSMQQPNTFISGTGHHSIFVFERKEMNKLIKLTHKSL